MKDSFQPVLYKLKNCRSKRNEIPTGDTIHHLTIKNDFFLFLIEINHLCITLQAGHTGDS